MTAIGITHHRSGTPARRVRSRSIARQALLACGILSGLLYVATDVLGGLRYPGYSFNSQAISELMATGAPSETFVDPLFITYGLLMLAFGIGVFREGATWSRMLRVIGVLLIAYAVSGFAGPTLFEMRPRGTGSLNSDTPHIILTGVLVSFTLLSMTLAAFTLGRRFRVYSLLTLLVMIVTGALSAPYGALLATDQPTPGFGILERVLIYSSLLWVAVFASALLRHSPLHRTTG
jgi:hypothetical membrane protein